MAYEKESISASPSAVPTQPSVMREEAVFDPYKVKALRTIGQANTSGEKAAEEPKPTEETVRLSPQVAALARKEQKFRQQQQALEQDRASLVAEKAEIAELKAMKAKLDAKDYSALDGMVDYNDYSTYQVNKLNGTDPVQEELSRIKNKMTEMEKSAQDNTSKQFDAAVNERKIAATQLLEKSADYPRVKKMGEKGRDAIVHHILDTWEHDSKELSIEEAAKEVEAEVTERAKQWAALLEEEKEVAVEADKKQLPPLKQGLKTLTNQVTAGDIKRSVKPLHHMSDAERWAEARRRSEEKLQQQSSR